MDRIRTWGVALTLAGCAHGPQTSSTTSPEFPVPATASRPGGGTEDGSSLTAPRTSFKTPLVPTSPEPTTTGPGVHGPVPGVAEQGEPLDDEKILEVARVMSSSAMDEGKLAQAHGASPAVRRLGEGLVSDGRAIEQRGDKVARATRLLPQDSGLSEGLQQERGQDLEALASRDGRAFDRAFVRGQVDRQRETIRLIDHTLLPNASSPQVRTFLLGLRPVAERRYEQARALKDKLD